MIRTIQERYSGSWPFYIASYGPTHAVADSSVTGKTAMCGVVVLNGTTEYNGFPSSVTCSDCIQILDRA